MKAKLKPLQTQKQTYSSYLSNKQQVKAKVLNTALLSNPFLKDQQHFRALGHQITLYNKRVLDKFISDQYEATSHEKLFSILSDLAYIETKDDMLTRLEETWKWWAEQKRKVKQRKDLGVIKYKTDRKVEKLRQMTQRLNKSEVIAPPNSNLLNQVRYAEIFPYQSNNRTVHEEMDVPIKRLAEYKTKKINIIDANLNDLQQMKPTDKVTYPMPPKYVPAQQMPLENIIPEKQPQKPPQNIEGQPANPDAANVDGQPPPQGDPNKPPEAQDPNQQDLGGFGQQPGEEENGGEQQEAPVEDKLAPKSKIYTLSLRQQEKYDSQKTYDRPYLFYKGTENLSQRRMEQRAVLKMQHSLQMKREEELSLQKAHQWATQKQKVDKQRQFLLQRRLNKPRYSFSEEEPERQQMLSLVDEKKYGFHIPTKPQAKIPINLDEKLPQIGQFKPYQRSIRSDRLKSLKHKFSTILNIKENPEERNIQASLCHISPRKKQFSAILEEHSPQKERQRQMEEIQRIKASLGKQRINVNLKNLSTALVPDTQDHRLDSFQSPSRTLPNNPFWVEPKKKKKK